MPFETLNAQPTIQPHRPAARVNLLSAALVAVLFVAGLGYFVWTTAQDYAAYPTSAWYLASSFALGLGLTLLPMLLPPLLGVRAFESAESSFLLSLGWLFVGPFGSISGGFPELLQATFYPATGARGAYVAFGPILHQARGMFTICWFFGLTLLLARHKWETGQSQPADKLGPWLPKSGSFVAALWLLFTLAVAWMAGNVLLGHRVHPASGWYLFANFVVGALFVAILRLAFSLARPSDAKPSGLSDGELDSRKFFLAFWGVSLGYLPKLVFDWFLLLSGKSKHLSHEMQNAQFAQGGWMLLLGMLLPIALFSVARFTHPPHDSPDASPLPSPQTEPLEANGGIESRPAH